ncbi:MAG: NADH-quinone oxidoreductase subunit L [Desulfovermiculus sp.]|nr:NADH-quinone oxidoreductase subunit L [Desulfovermiculus sp.]
MFDYIWLIPVLPLIGVLINGLLGRRLEEVNKSLIHWIACSAVGLSFVLTVITFFQLLSLPGSERLVEYVWFEWIRAGDFSVSVAYQIDPLSMVMCLFVTGVGFLIHIYSIGYMLHSEGRYYRYFTYLNLFMFSMINLILANNFLLMFLGWEGVGMCSYLLIGFWFGNLDNAKAGKKAFITNRVGDFAFLVGLLLLLVALGEHGVWSLRFTEVFEHAHLLNQSLVTAVCLLFFIGCTAKSAQIPLYIWLPDAMAGPTPVSALIHAATMVTSGIYFVARSNVLYSMSPLSMQVVAVIGALTALLAATIALTQNDIKRVLAYSTVSQLGYMFLGLGVGAFSAGIFHVVTHSFFKALLFLCAGSVMHSLANEQDMRNMGGMRKKIPVTYITMLLGTLAIAGFPGLSGFFSKDEILWYTFANGHPFLWLIGVFTAGLTAFYMFRLIFMTFFNECRAPQDVQKHIHESPKSMTVPMSILAVLSVIGGAIGVPAVLGGNNRIEHFLEPVMPHVAHGHHSASTEYLLMVISVCIVFIGIGLAYTMYVRKRDIPGELATKFKWLYAAMFNKWYVDELYSFLFVRPLHGLSLLMWKGFDVGIIDGAVNGVANVVGWCGSRLRTVQTGYVQAYAISFLFGAMLLVMYSVFALV